jgi:putative endonuclease
MKHGYTYIMGSASGTLYIGVTSDIFLRVSQHKNGTFKGFSRTYECTRLLAITRETQLKGWRREKKLNLIRKTNPDFRDLAEKWGWKLITSQERMEP